MSCVFGPVPSRRLGRSLGVDLIPFKTCTYDCVYCQIGCTREKTVERKEWVSVEQVIEDLREKLAHKPDYITLSGSGEPTLYAGIGGLVERIKAITEVPIAVITNGSLLWREEVRRSLLEVDLVVPSLDAGDEPAWQAANRPHESLRFARMLEGLVDFRRAFRGQYWLEMFLLGGLTDTDEAVQKLAGCAARIGPDRVQLNTVTRPPAERSAEGVPIQRLVELAELFLPKAEVIAEFRKADPTLEWMADRTEILDMLRRRPCSLEDVADGLGIPAHQASKYIEELEAAGAVTRQEVYGTLYYKPVDSSVG